MPYRIFGGERLLHLSEAAAPHPAGPAAVRLCQGPGAVRRPRHHHHPGRHGGGGDVPHVSDAAGLRYFEAGPGGLPLPPGLRRRGRAIRRAAPGAPSEDRRNEGLSGRLSPGAHRLDAGAIRRGGGLPGIRHDGGRSPGGGHGAGLPAAHPAAVPLQWGRGGGAVPPLPGPGGTEAPRDGPAAAGDHPRAAAGSRPAAPGEGAGSGGVLLRGPCLPLGRRPSAQLRPAAPWNWGSPSPFTRTPR